MNCESTEEISLQQDGVLLNLAKELAINHYNVSQIHSDKDDVFVKIFTD